MVGEHVHVRGRLLPAAAAIAVSTLVLTLLTLLNLRDVSATALTYDVFRLGAAVMFVAAGILRLTRCQVTGEQQAGLVGASLFVLAALTLPLENLTGQIVPDAVEPSLFASAHAAGTLVYLGLTLRALSGPGRLALLGVVVWVPLAALDVLGGEALADVLLAACLLGVARVAAGRDAGLLACLGVVELLRCLENLDPGSWALPAAALLASVAMVAAHCAYVDLDDALHSNPPAVRRPRPQVAEDHGDPVDFGVTGVVATVADRHRLTGQEVRVRGGAGIAHARPDDLVVALDELLGNARRHAAGSPVTVHVVAIGSRVAVSVTDRGPGLSAATAEAAFAPGTGLELARNRLREGGGDLELHSRIGGATFVVSLPAARTVPDRPLAALSPCAG
jgi:signal transduction histidine kinase